MNIGKYITVLIGIGIIAGIQVFHSHEHGEHEHGCHGHEHLNVDVPFENFSIRIDST